MKITFTPLIILFLLFNINKSSGQITGTIKDDNGESLAFAAVYVKGTTSGTFSNDKGEYLLNLNKGKQTLVFRYMGYKTIEMDIDYKGTKIYKDITMYPDNVMLQEVVIKANAEDPAYAIIRKAIKAAPAFRNKPQNIKARIYQKLKIELLKVPEKVFVIKVAKTEKDKKEIRELLDTSKNVLLVTETVSDLYRGENGKNKEIILSSKISGDKKSYANLSAIFSNIDFYNNYITLGRKLISPLSSNAMMFYKYKLLGTFYDNSGNLINKIRVIPKRKYDAVVDGIILITEDIWNIHGIDVTVNSKNTNIRFMDTINIKQDFKQLDDNTWGLLSQYATFNIDVLGFSAKGYHTRNFSSYELNHQFDKGFFDNIVFKIEEQANKRDSIYWEKIRPVPLSLKERKGYSKMDSLEAVTNSKEYMDSVDRATNKFGLMNLLVGYKHNNSYKKSYWSVSSPLTVIFYNPVQGNNTSMKFIYSKRYNYKKHLKIKLAAEYGFADKQLLPYGQIKYVQNRKKKAIYTIGAGRRYFQPSDQNMVSAVLNSYTALAFGKNYLQLYEKKYIYIKAQRLLGLKLKADLNVNLGQRSSLQNHSSDGLFKKWEFPPNIYSGGDSIQYKNKFDISLRLIYKPFARFMDSPYGYYTLPSSYPIFEFYYRKAIDLDDDFATYDFIKAGIKGTLPTGLLGNTKYYLEAGTFLNHDRTDIIDDKFFEGNQMYMMTGNKYYNSFHLLPFYYRAGFKSYYMIRLQQHTQGMFISKIPLLKLLKAEEVFNFDILQIEDKPTYLEAGIGLKKIFGLLNIRYTWAFSDWIKADDGVTFSIIYSFGSI